MLDMRSASALADSTWGWFRDEVNRVNRELIELLEASMPEADPLWLIKNERAAAEFGLERDAHLNDALKEALSRAGFQALTSANFPDVLRAWGVPFRIFSVC